MGPIEAMVQDIINKKVLEDFPQIQLPLCGPRKLRRM